MKALPPCPPAPFRLCVLICLCALTALTLLTGFPSSPAQAADLLIYGGGGGGGAGNGNAGGAGGAAGGPDSDGGGGNAGGAGDLSGAGGGGGGAGGTGSNGDAGGAGGVDGPYGGAGGKGGTGGGAGDDGGDATASPGGSSYSNVTVAGGNGGNSGTNGGGAGGNGGAASLTLTDSTVEALIVASGSAGTGGGGAGGAGGDASFTANTLRTGNISLTTHDGNVTFTLNNALVWTGSGAFTVTRNTGPAAININSLTIDGGTVNNVNYDNLIAPTVFSYTQSDITLGDNGATFNTAGGDQIVGRTLTGNGGLTKEGTSTLTLTGSNTYGGGTTITAGTLKGNIAANTDLSIALGAKYDGAGATRFLSALNGEGNVLNTNGLIVQSGTFSGVIDRSNTGGLTKDGAGTLRLTGWNDYSGGTIIKAGTLRGHIANNTDLSIAAGATYDGSGRAGQFPRSLSALNGEGTIRNTNGLAVKSGTFGGVIDSSNTGVLFKHSAGTLILTGENTYTGDTIIEEGTLQIGDGGTSGSVKGDIENNANLVFNRSNDVTHDRIISGTGNLIKDGAGTLELTGNNTYGGGTTIKAGTLKGEIAANTALSIALGAKYDGAGKARSLSALNGEGNVFNTNGLIVQSGTFGGVIDSSNTGGLTKDREGTLTLTGTNAYTGTTTIKAGTLALSGGGTLGASSLLDLRGGALDISGIAPASLSLPDMDVRGPARLDIGDRTADFSGKTLSFYVPSDMGAGGTLLSVGGAGITDIGNSTVRVGIAGSSSPLDEGDAVTLIDAPDGTLQGDPANTGSKGEGMQGVILRYAFDVARIGNRLTATVAEAPKADPRAKALSEGFVGGLSLSLQGADLAAGRGMESAVRASSATVRAGTSAFAGFGALSGGMLRSNTGSHVDMNSLSLLTGLAWGVDLAPGRLTLGAFFEYGNGSYDTYNSFGNAASVRGDGDTRYLGGGVLARMNFAPAETLGGPGHFYAEASGRAGRTRNEYDSSDLRDAAGRKADYDSASPYYGLHVGAGYVWSISESVGLDLYGKYFWTRQKGDGVRLSTGENLRFKDADSSRLRLGGRLACTVNEHVAPYVGAAWEREFDGKARATSNGFDLDAPSLRGDTGVGELGLSLTPSADLPLTVDLGVQGYTGKREGVTGSLMVKFAF